MGGLRYTGQADTFTVAETGKTYTKNADGKTAILAGFPKETAILMAMNSKMHTFEEDGEDYVEKVTAPDPTPDTKVNPGGKS